MKISMNVILKITIIIWAIVLILVFIFCPRRNDIHHSSYEFKNIRINNITVLCIEKIKNEYSDVLYSSQEEIKSSIFYPLTTEERYIVESIVCGESGIEPYWGKVAVASCILNACLLEDKRPEEIQIMYGYAGWKPIEEFESECMEAYGNTKFADEVREAVSQVFDKGEVYSNEILWFYAPKYSRGSWHQTQKFVVEISNHRFYAPWN